MEKRNYYIFTDWWHNGGHVPGGCGPWKGQGLQSLSSCRHPLLLQVPFMSGPPGCNTNGQKAWLPFPESFPSCMLQLTRLVAASRGPAWLTKLLIFDELNCSKTWRFGILLSRVICILTGYAWTLGLAQRNKLLMLEFPTRQVGETDIFLGFMFQCQPSNHVRASTLLCLPLPTSSLTFPSSVSSSPSFCFSSFSSNSSF